jgi:hypothetical protein
LIHVNVMISLRTGYNSFKKAAEYNTKDGFKP